MKERKEREAVRVQGKIIILNILSSKNTKNENNRHQKELKEQNSVLFCNHNKKKDFFMVLMKSLNILKFSH